MANTYNLISSNVLTSSAASITFSAIPATYTDLVLRASVRSDVASLVDILKLTYNSISGTNYSYTLMYSNVINSGTGDNDQNQSTLRHGYVDGNTTTANTFASTEIFIPNYAGSTAKPSSSFSVSENNATSTGDWYVSAWAGLSQSTAAITGITIASVNSANFMSTSSFYLYGISNA